MPLPRAALALVATVLAAPTWAQEGMSDGARDAFRAEVRAYLLENPEVLMEALGVLEARDADAQAAADAALIEARRAAIFEDDRSWVGGNPEGDVTLVEFMDYRCGYCRRAFAEVEDLVSSDGGVRFVLKEFPILGEQSEMASRFAIAVRQLHGDDAYKDAHDALMALDADIDAATLGRLAEGLALDPAPILAAMESDAVTAVIEENRALAQALGITGTPTFVMGDRMVRGYVPLEGMQALLIEERAG